LTISKTFVRKEINKAHIDMIKDLSKSYLDLLQRYIKIYKDKKIKDIFDETEKMYAEFIELSHEAMKGIRKELTNEDSELLYFPISQIVKSMEGTVERVKSVFANAVSKEIS
jgi:Ribonuclease G/E